MLCSVEQNKAIQVFVSMIDICFWYHFIGNCFRIFFRPKNYFSQAPPASTSTSRIKKFYSFFSIHIEKLSIHLELSPILFIFGWLVDNQLVAAHSKSCKFSGNYSGYIVFLAFY